MPALSPRVIGGFALFVDLVLEVLKNALYALQHKGVTMKRILLPFNKLHLFRSHF